jgi:hypothetical protein
VEACSCRSVNRLLCIAALLASLGAAAIGQGSAGTDGKLEPRFLVDMPTAGMADKGTMVLDVDFYQEGGVLFGISAGILDRFSFGVSYGGSRIIGSGSPVMNPIPGVNLRLRILEEGLVLPALTLGFDTQGKDGYLKDLDRFQVKSPGLFVAASKNYAFLGYLSIHGGVNYSLERKDGDKDVNVYTGVEKTIGAVLSAILEYNFATNDNSGEAVGKGWGYINAALRLMLGNGLTISLNLKDMVKNGPNITIANRTVCLEYARAF